MGLPEHRPGVSVTALGIVVTFSNKFLEQQFEQLAEEAGMEAVVGDPDLFKQYVAAGIYHTTLNGRIMDALNNTEQAGVVEF